MAQARIDLKREKEERDKKRIKDVGGGLLHEITKPGDVSLHSSKSY